jgi:heat-inducible transcriptional repressor
VVVLQEARVLQQTLALERPFSQEELTFVARKLNDLLAGKTAAQMKALALDASPVETAVVDSAATMLEAAEATDAEPSFLEGMRDLLRQPEFTQGDRILGLIENLEERNLARAIPIASDDGGAVRIIIGGEHPVDALRVCSVITAHYTGPAGLRGALSVVGPTRMHYARAVSTVRYMSSLMAELLGVYFA